MGMVACMLHNRDREWSTDHNRLFFIKSQTIDFIRFSSIEFLYIREHWIRHVHIVAGRRATYVAMHGILSSNRST